MAITSYRFLLPKELTLKEDAIMIAFWVLFDSIETPVIAEYTGEVKEFGDLMARIAVLPFKMTFGITSLLVQCTASLAKWSCNIVCGCLAKVFDVVLYIHGYCWPVLVELSNNCVLQLFVQEHHEPGLASYIIHGMNTVLHVLYFMVKLVLLDPIDTIVYYSWSDMTVTREATTTFV